MRTVLRVLAAVQTWAAVAAGVVAALTAVVFLAAGEPQLVPYLAFLAGTAAVVASVGGILWCLTVLTVPPPAPPPPRAARAGLRLLARTELGAALLLGVAAAVLASDALFVRPSFGATGLLPLAVLFTALGLAGVGAILLCLVRLAYPSRPAADEPAPRPPDLLVGGCTVYAAFVVVVATSVTAGGLAWAGLVSGRQSLAPTVAAVGLVVALVAGLVWCAPVVARRSGPPPGRPGGGWLRALAVAQLVLGAALAVGGVAYGWHHLGAPTWPPTERALMGAGVCLLALGLSCVGGVLWCAVRVAYPGRPEA